MRYCHSSPHGKLNLTNCFLAPKQKYPDLFPVDSQAMQQNIVCKHYLTKVAAPLSTLVPQFQGFLIVLIFLLIWASTPYSYHYPLLTLPSAAWAFFSALRATIRIISRSAAAASRNKASSSCSSLFNFSDGIFTDFSRRPVKIYPQSAFNSGCSNAAARTASTGIESRFFRIENAFGSSPKNSATSLSFFKSSSCLILSKKPTKSIQNLLK